MRRLVGIGYRKPLAKWMSGCPRAVECLEITAEHFFDGGSDRLRELSQTYPLFVHGLGLSLGTPGPLDQETLARFSQIVEQADPRWISEHVSFTRSGEVDLGHLNPVRPTLESLNVVAEHARELASRCRKPLILENITSYVRLEGDMKETDFLNRLCDKADCGILLDVTNLFINSCNHGFDASQWLREIEPQRIVQLHIVGYSKREGRWEDGHGESIQPDLLELLGEVLAYAPVRAVILERDENLADPDEIVGELEKIRSVSGEN